MSRLETVKEHLKPGKVYRRKDLTTWSNAVDRHLELLLKDGTLKKLSPGLYYYPKKTAFGFAPPDDSDLVLSFLKDNRFLITSQNAFNALGVGTTQLYNSTTVYNHKRHGEFKLGNRTFNFRIKPHFPKHVTEEFLLVDLVNNLNLLAEDKDQVLAGVEKRVQNMDMPKLKRSVATYGNVRTQQIFSRFLNQLHGS